VHGERLSARAMVLKDEMHERNESRGMYLAAQLVGKSEKVYKYINLEQADYRNHIWNVGAYKHRKITSTVKRSSTLCGQMQNRNKQIMAREQYPYRKIPY